MKVFLSHLRTSIMSRLMWAYRAPLTLGELFIVRHTPAASYKEMVILDPKEVSRESFLCHIMAALDMIASADPIRFSRVQREIKYVLNVPSSSGSDYTRS